MSKPADKFEAARIVVETIKEFDPQEQQMIFRWAAESLGLQLPYSSSNSLSSNTSGSNQQSIERPPATQPTSATQDIKSFVAEKDPKSDMQFAATIAYFYQFKASEAERKTSITETDLLDACRKADRPRPKQPRFTLNNAFRAGLLDRPTKGSFSINSVGENLVAMTLPGNGAAPTVRGGTKRRSPNSAKVERGTVRKSIRKARPKA